MKTIIYTFCISYLIFLTSCADFTEVKPKGKNLLTTTDEIELLLNYEYYFSAADEQNMAGDLLTTISNVHNEIAQPIKTRNSIMLTFDHTNQDKMAELTNSDNDYSGWYNVIGRVANVVLQQIDEAQGDESVKKQLKSEALVLRAYFHYLAVNKFAKAYNPTTAATDPGIPYMKHDRDITQPAKKQTIKEVYQFILEDLEEAINLNSLPHEAINRMRISMPCAYAAKALALINMQRFEEAAQAAKQALNINSYINNYNQMLTTITGNITGGVYEVIYRPQLECKEDYFYTHDLASFRAIMPCAWNAFEKGHACRDKMNIDRMTYDYHSGLGLSLYGLDYNVIFDLNSGWNSMGMKTTHMYLIIAENEIRNGRYKEAMATLDKIRINRIDPVSYTPLEGTVDNETDAIRLLKQTSHGENIWSCFNFINRKRWNQLEKQYHETIIRELGESGTYTLNPDSPMWIFPFPMNATNNNPNLSQNYK